MKNIVHYGEIYFFLHLSSIFPVKYDFMKPKDLRDQGFRVDISEIAMILL